MFALGSGNSAATISTVNQIGQGIRARLFHPNLGNEVLEGSLFIDRSMVRFTSESVVHEFPTERLEADWNDREGRVYFSDSGDPDLSIFTGDCSAIAYSPVPQLQELRAQITAHKSRKDFTRRLRLTGYFAIAAVVLVAVISWAMGAMVRSIATKVPPKWERSFGEEMIKELRADASLIEDSNQVARLTALAAPLLKVVPNAGKEVQFFLVDDSEPNAFALPGGFVVVNTGLLTLAERPEEIQAVLAHELAHVTEKHLVRQVVASSGPVLIFGLFLRSDNGLMNLLSAGSGLVMVQGFSKEFETEADEVGWNYLVAANIDPRGMIGMFEKFQASDRMAALGIKVPEAFSSHPLMEKRIARLEKKWAKLKRKDGFLTQTNSLPGIILK